MQPGEHAKTEVNYYIQTPFPFCLYASPNLDGVLKHEGP